MGIQKSGPFGGFYGKTGPLVGRRIKGQNMITALHHPSTKPSTPDQLKVQDRFGMLNGFLFKIKKLVKPGFKKYARNNSPVNAAFKYNYPNAFVLTEGIYQLNYPALVYSRGHVSSPSLVTLALNGGSITLGWAPQQESLYCRNTDLATILVYNKDKDTIYTSVFKTSRGNLGYVMEIPVDFVENELHCYMSFSSADGKLVGDSRYLGSLVKSPL